MNGTEELLSQLTSSAVVIYGIQSLKKSRLFPWISQETKVLNRLLAWGGSAIAAIGVHYSFDATQGQLVITGLTVGGILHGGWHWLQQMALTQLAYDSAINNKYVPTAGDNAITKQPKAEQP